MPAPIPASRPDIGAIATHLAALADTSWCPRCDTAITPVLTDVTNLLTLAASLYDELARVRLEAANLRAAMQAALNAAAEGESDPLAYLRWELDSEKLSPEACRGCA